MPPLHPFLVHFPIALLTIGFCADVLAVLRGKPAVQKIGWWNLVLGTAGLIGAVVSGLVAKSDYLSETETRMRATSSLIASMPMGADTDALASHEQLAFVTVAWGLLLLYWRIRNKTAVPPQLPRLYILCAACLIGLLWYTAWFGGELVYAFGVGVVHTPVP